MKMNALEVLLHKEETKIKQQKTTTAAKKRKLYYHKEKTELISVS